MNRIVASLVFVAVFTGCSDIALLRKASSAYVYAETRYETRCVTITAPKAPEECVAEEVRLKPYWEELSATMAAAIIGPLTKAQRERLKVIRKELE